MRGFPWVDTSVVALASALAFSIGCGGAGTKPRTCEDDSGCASGSRCVQRSCAANAAPVARIALPPAPVTYDLLTFDGAESADADAPLDGIASYAWVFRPLDAPCPAPVSASTGPQATVRFGCPGTYAVDLEVADGMGVTGSTTREVVVGARGAPLVEVGPDVLAEHACSGDPLVCRPDGPVSLTAAAPAAAGEVSYQWTVEAPPNRPLGADRRVVFDPGPDVASPAVGIETDAAAISGDWIFRVVARDAAGPLGEAAVRVTVGNRPPEIVEQVLPLPHTFDPRVRMFEASGTIRIRIEDPDGDPIAERSAMWRHLNDGGATFVGVDTGDALTVQIAVPYTAPEDALNLIGREGLERTVELRVFDVNGGDDFESWPIIVENRPPTLPGNAAGASVEHAYTPASASYTAELPVAQSWTDPDNDPLFQAGPTGDADCASISFVRPSWASAVQNPVVSCAAPFATVGTLQNFSREHSVTIAARDPWTPAPHAVQTSLTIGNSAPAYHEPFLKIATTCTKSTTACCETDPETRRCIAWATQHGAGSAVVSGLFTDADGDPLDVRVGSTSSTCASSGGSCAVTITVPATDTCPGDTVAIVAVAATDGVATASHSMVVDLACQ